MGFLLFLLLAYLVLSFALTQVFAKAKETEPSLPLEPKDGWIPGVNFAKWCHLIGRKPVYALWLLVPLVNVFIYAGMCVDLARSFGFVRFRDAIGAVIAAPLYFLWMVRQPKAVYGGPVLLQEQAYRKSLAEAEAAGETRRVERLTRENPYKRSSGREWAEAIIFAVAAAALIRLFVFEMFTIPTSSMEGSMLVGDYLLVSKAHYGIRTPQTIAMIPLLHNRLPFNLGESYLKWPKLDMHRLPALEAIDRNDPIVFNFPLGDSVYVTPGRTWSAEDYRVGSVADRRGNPISSPTTELVTRPLDKKDHYVKRAVAVAGDTVQIIDRQLYVNGKSAVNPPHIQYTYTVTKPEGVAFDPVRMVDWGISAEDLRVGTPQQYSQVISRPSFNAVLSSEQRDKLQAVDPRVQIEPVISKPPSADTARARYSAEELRRVEAFERRQEMRLFPHDPDNFSGWTIDNYGPLVVPKAGMTVAIGPRNIALYRRVIEVYEGHDLQVDRTGITIDGQRATDYTFAQDYYWAMGDNRHGSEDSRFWGFVPADHIVGKPLFIWFSTKNANMADGIRWDRIFQGATQMD